MDNPATFTYSDALDTLIWHIINDDVSAEDVTWVRRALSQVNIFFSEEERAFFGSILQAVSAAPTEEIDNDE